MGTSFLLSYANDPDQPGRPDESPSATDPMAASVASDG